MLRRLYRLCVALCRILTRHECVQRRLEVEHVAQWADVARERRALAQRRLDAALMDM